MTIRSMEVFLTVAETGSMRGAAEKLFISQPSVSGVISDLEKEFGVKLFERLGKKLYITSEGEKLAAYARRIISLKSEIERQMNPSNIETPLRIGATVTVGTSVICDILKEFNEKTHTVAPHLFINNTKIIEKMLLDNQLDVAVVEGQVTDEDLTAFPVLSDELKLICPKNHPFAAFDSIHVKQLDGIPLIMREKESFSREIIDNMFLSMKISQNIIWQCNNTQAILKAVENDFGFSILSYRIIDKMDNLVAIDITGYPLKRYFWLVIHKDKFVSNNLKIFMEICQDLEPDLHR